MSQKIRIWPLFQVAPSSHLSCPKLCIPVWPDTLISAFAVCALGPRPPLIYPHMQLGQSTYYIPVRSGLSPLPSSMALAHGLFISS